MSRINGNGKDVSEVETALAVIKTPPIVIPPTGAERRALIRHVRQLRVEETKHRDAQQAAARAATAARQAVTPPAASGLSTVGGGATTRGAQPAASSYYRNTPTTATAPKKEIPAGAVVEYRKRGAYASATSDAGFETTLYPETKEIVLPRNKQNNVLRFSPYAWAKLVWFRDRGGTEIAGFGVTPLDDQLYIEDFITCEQEGSPAFVKFDDDAVNKYLMDMCQAGYKPEQCLRIWLHTHPGNSASPSSTDHDTFAEAFGGCDWAVMFILAKGGETHAKLRYNIGPGSVIDIKTMLDYSSLPFEGVTEADVAQWEEDYCNHLIKKEWNWVDYQYTDYDYYRRNNPDNPTSGFAGSGSGADAGHGGYSYQDQNGRTVATPHSPAARASETRELSTSDRAAIGEWDDMLATETDAAEQLGEDAVNSQVSDEAVVVLGVEDGTVLMRLLAASSMSPCDIIEPHDCLISGQEELIIRIDDHGVVATNKGWYEYGSRSWPVVSEGLMVGAFNEICDDLPAAYGKLHWAKNKHGEELYFNRVTEIMIEIVEMDDVEDFKDTTDLEILTRADAEALTGSDMVRRRAERRARIAGSDSSTVASGEEAPGFAAEGGFQVPDHKPESLSAAVADAVADTRAEVVAELAAETRALNDARLEGASVTDSQEASAADTQAAMARLEEAKKASTPVADEIPSDFVEPLEDDELDASDITVHEPVLEEDAETKEDLFGSNAD